VSVRRLLAWVVATGLVVAVGDRRLPAAEAVSVRRFLAWVVATGLVVAVGGSGLVSGCAGGPESGDLIIRAGRLFDGTGAPVQSDVRILVRGGTIEGIEPDVGEPPAGVRVLDARGMTVMPGLINAHLHLAGSGACTAGVGVGIGQMTRNTYALLANGVTTAADLGAPIAVALALRRWSGTARSRGPRILVAGPMLTAPNGYLTDLAGGQLVDVGAVWPIASVEEGRAAVRELSNRGVDFIKIGLQERGFDGKHLPLLDHERVCAVVEEAHKLEMRVMAHACEASTYALALDCAVDVIAHGAIEPLDAALVERIAAAGTPVMPTLFVFEAILWGPEHPEYLRSAAAERVLSDETRNDLRDYAEADKSSGESLPPHFMPGISRIRAEAASMALRANVAQLHASGARLGFGTDSGVCFNYVGSELEELRRLVEVGLTPTEALVVATSGGARVLDMQDALGRIAPHYRADIIAVEGRPDERIDDLQNVRHVVIDGVEQTVEPPGPGRWLALGVRTAHLTLTIWLP